MGRPPRLSPDSIVDAALSLVDDEGLEGFSTRRLAERLKVAGPSLYNHFATKEDILEAVADRIMAEVDTSYFVDRPWTEALRLWARSYRHALAAHPNMVPVVARGPGRRPHALAMSDNVMGGLLRDGWTPSQVSYLGAIVRYLAVGSATGFAGGFPDDPELYAHGYPNLSRAAHRLSGRSTSVDDGAFELGVDALIAGLVQMRQEAESTRAAVGA
jgi:AcrR family transcriptional regulator